MSNIESENTCSMTAFSKYFKLLALLLLLTGLGSCKLFKKPCGCNNFGTMEYESPADSTVSVEHAVAY